MFVRQCFRNKDGKRHAYWALVESHRTAAGPRQRVVAWLGKLDEAGRLGVEQSARQTESSNDSPAVCEQLSLFDQVDNHAPVEPQWVEVDASGVRVENCRHFGGPWLALELVRKLHLDKFPAGILPSGRTQVAWWRSALILVVARLCKPSATCMSLSIGIPNQHSPSCSGCRPIA